LTTVPLSDLVLSGSWDGHVRIWKVSEDRRRLEGVGILGLDRSDEDTLLSGEVGKVNGHVPDEPKAVRGVVNDIAVFERGDKGREGLCVVAAVSKEHRLAKWVKHPARNGAVVFEVARKALGHGLSNGTEMVQTNGVR